jgi:hypothetical protein
MIFEKIEEILFRIKLMCFRFGFRVSFGYDDVRLLKKFKGIIMERRALKDMIYGSIEEMLQNNRYYYHSSIGSHYSHFTEEGKKNLGEFLDIIAFEMRKCRDLEDEQRSKDLVMKELTK